MLLTAVRHGEDANVVQDAIGAVAQPVNVGSHDEAVATEADELNPEPIGGVAQTVDAPLVFDIIAASNYRPAGRGPVGRAMANEVLKRLRETSAVDEVDRCTDFGLARLLVEPSPSPRNNRP